MKRLNQSLENSPRTLPKKARKIKASSLFVWLMIASSANGQSHRSLPNAVLVEPARYQGERVTVRWDTSSRVGGAGATAGAVSSAGSVGAKSGGGAFLVTAFDMDGRKIWSLRTTEDKVTMAREVVAYEVVVTPAKAGANAPGWVAIDGPLAKGSFEQSQHVSPIIPPTGVEPPPAGVPSPSLPAAVVVVPTVAVRFSPIAMPSPSPMPMVAASTPTPALTPVPVVVAIPEPTPQTKPTLLAVVPAFDEDPPRLKGGFLMAAGLSGRGLLSLARSDVDVTASAPAQGGGGGWVLPIGPYVAHTLWIQSVQFKDQVTTSVGGNSATVDVKWTTRGGDMGLLVNGAAFIDSEWPVFIGVGAVVANRQLAVLPQDFDATLGLVPDVEGLPQLNVGPSVMLAWHGRSLGVHLQGNQEIDSQARGQVLTGRALLMWSPMRPIGVFTGMTVEESRASLCRGTDDYCLRYGNFKTRVTTATALLGVGAMW